MGKIIDATGYDIDKGKIVRLLPNYQEFFEPLADKEIKLLELGIYEGASLLLWRDYFEKGTIVGLDCNPVHVEDQTGRIHTYQGLQQDIKLLDRIANEQAPEGFDVIIDDCSHMGRLTRISFWHLFEKHLKPGGIYAIEDWCTGYADWWPDGRHLKSESHMVNTGLSSRKDYLIVAAFQLLSAFSPRLAMLYSKVSPYSRIPSHTRGMVGFVKELIDTWGLGAVPRPEKAHEIDYSYKIHRMHIFWNHVIVVKSHSQSTDENQT